MSEGEMISPEKGESKAIDGSLPSRQRWSVDSVLKLIQVFAIVGAALWALHEYTSFRREHDQLLLAQSRFAVEQQDILKQQQALALDMAKVQLKSEQTREELTQVELSSARLPRLALTHNLEVSRTGRRTKELGEYRANLTVKVTNISKETLELTFSVVEYFVGTLALGEIEEPLIAPINSPSTMFDSEESGVVTWKRLDFSVDALEESNFTEYKEILSSVGIDLNRKKLDTGLSGHLRPGETSLFKNLYFVRAPMDAFVGFTVTLGVNGGGKRGSLWTIENSQYLQGVGT